MNNGAKDAHFALAAWQAIDKLYGVIEFDLKGVILTANENTLRQLGYRENELIGKNHRLLIPDDEAELADIHGFWNQLLRDMFRSGEFRRRTNDGRIIWLQESYSLIHDSLGKPERILSLATNITELKDREAADISKVKAIQQSMAVAEFNADGTIIAANTIFLDLMGFQRDEIIGQHHRIFVGKEEAASPEYQNFWASLAKGESQRGQYKRFAKTGEMVWLETCYNPILDANGNLNRVLKFAYDITETIKQSIDLSKKTTQLEVALQDAHETEQVRLEQDRTLQDMSTPVTPIWDGILMLPLVGMVDSTRTDEIMRKTLDRISQSNARMFILDISGVPMVDSAVANQLIKITKATRIMGCETLVSGVSSSIAHTIVELGVDISELRTKATLRDALFTCLSEISNQSRDPFTSQPYPPMHQPMQQQMHLPFSMHTPQF